MHRNIAIQHSFNAAFPRFFKRNTINFVKNIDPHRRNTDLKSCLRALIEILWSHTRHRSAIRN